MPVAKLAGGGESMSLVPMSGDHTRMLPDTTEMYIGMGCTAERVAERWRVAGARPSPVRPRVSSCWRAS